MKLKDYQFLKVYAERGYTIFEIYEIPQVKWKRPLRWKLEVPQIEFYNRHTKKSKTDRLMNAIKFLCYGAEGFFDQR